MSHDPDRDDERRFAEQLQYSAALGQARREAERNLRRFEDALHVLSGQILELDNMRAPLAAAAIRPELVEAVAAVIDTARTAGAWSDQLPTTSEYDPVGRRAVRVFELAANGDNTKALDLLRRMPQAALRLRNLANALYRRVDPVEQARRNTEALMMALDVEGQSQTQPPAAPPGGPRQGEGDDKVNASAAIIGDETSTEEPTDRQCLILETMLEHEITSERRRQSRTAIVSLINRTHKSSSYGHDFAKLVKDGLLKSLEGPSGGYWLTAAGKKQAQRLRDSNQ